MRRAVHFQVLIFWGSISLVFTSSCFLVSCTTGISKENLALTGTIHINYTNKKAGYTWDFKRNVNQVLGYVNHYTNADGNLINIKYSGNRLIGLDYKASRLYFWDSNMNPSGSYGEKGIDSIYRNNGIMHFDYQSNYLYLYDFGSRAVKKIDPDKKLLSYYSKFSNPTGIYRVGHLAKESYVYVQPKDSVERDMEFVFFDSTDRNPKKAFSLNKLLEITNKEEYPSMAYDGNFVSNPNSNFIVYYCSFGGIFFCFNKHDATFSFYNRTIDQTPIPKATYVKISPIHQSLEIYPNIMFFPSAALNGNRLFLLNNINPTKNYIADVYDLGNGGSYAGSFFVPFSKEGKKPVSIAVNDMYLYVLYEDQQIVKYAINLL